MLHTSIIGCSRGTAEQGGDFKLTSEVGPEGRYRVRREPDGPAALDRLGFAWNVDFVGVGEGATHAQEVALRLDTTPRGARLSGP